jgi:ketosteroid isomerase-like protein
VTDSSAALGALVTRQEIVDVLGAYCERLDEYDIDGVAELFIEDCVTDYGPGRGGPVRGRQHVRDRIATGQAEFRRTHHQLGQIRVDLHDDADAGALSYLTAFHERWDGSTARVHLRYVDRLHKSGGRWRIAARTVQVTAVEGFDGVPWHWVERATPERAQG